MTVGDDVITGSGAVVFRDVPAGTTAVGNPARPVRPKGWPAAAAQDSATAPDQEL